MRLPLPPPSVLEQINEAYFSLDRAWRYTYVNYLTEKFEKRSRKELLGKVIWEEYPQSKKTLFYLKYHEAMATGVPVEFQEYLQGMWFEVRVYPTDAGLSIFYRDISDRKRLEESKDDFVRMASHELKTPITSLRLYTELLLQTAKAGTPTGVYAERMLHQIDRLNKLVTSLLDLSKIELDKLDYEYKPFDLVELVAEVAGHPGRWICNGVTDCVTVTTKLKRALVHGDRDRISQVIGNLLDNAVKYSPTSGRITVRLTLDQRRPRQVQLEVTDCGIGIDLADQKKIFDRHFQVADAHGRTYPGLGIGLYISKVIVEHHQGQIWVKSRPAAGATFYVSLPLHDQNKKRRP